MLGTATSTGDLPDILLREHSSLEGVLLSEPEVALLAREFSSRLDFMPTPTPSVYTLQAHQYAGLIVLPTGRVIEIRPKVRIGVLFAMLAKAHRLADFGPDPQACTSVGELFEFVVSFYVGLVEELVAVGMLRGFQPLEHDLLTVRGKLLLTETIRQRPVVRDRHWCAFTEFTADVPENRILKLACDALMPFPYRRTPDLASRLRRLLRVFAQVTLPRSADELFDRVVYHRLNEHYRPALSLARLLLSSLSPSGVRGPHQFLAFLVDMNQLFEQYVVVALQEAAVAQHDVVVVPQDAHPLDLNQEVTVKPDAVVYSGDAPVLVLDAKYKLDDPNIDVYQAVAYCHALGLPTAILAYPASEGLAAARHRIRPHAGLEIVVCPLNLSGDVADLRRQTATFVASVWRETLRVHSPRERRPEHVFQNPRRGDLSTEVLNAAGSSLASD